jgi:hypothetical protein
MLMKKHAVQLGLFLCTTLALTACGQRKASTQGPQSQSQYVTLNEPFQCVSAKATIESLVNQDRNSAARLYPGLNTDAQKFLDETLAQFATHAKCMAAVQSYGKKLKNNRQKTLEDERTLKFYSHIHADILNAAVAAAERLHGSSGRCSTSQDAGSFDPLTDVTIECIFPTDRAKQYVAFVALDKTQGVPMILAWRTSQTDSALVGAANARYVLEVQADLWHAFKSQDGIKETESARTPSYKLRNQSTKEVDFWLDGTRADGAAKLRKSIYGKLLPAGCPNN